MAKLRDDSSMLKLFTEHVKGEEMYGLTVHAVMRITESVRIFSRNLHPSVPYKSDRFPVYFVYFAKLEKSADAKLPRTWKHLDF